MSLDPVDHVAAALERLPQQFQGKEKIEAYLTALARQAQEIEDAFQDLLLLRRIDVATGAALTRLGDIVGQQANGEDESFFRRMIRARIAANRSRGTTEQLIRVAAAFFSNLRPPLRVEVDNQGTAAVVVRILGVALAVEAANEGHDDVTLMSIFLPFLRAARAAGVRVLAEWTPQLDQSTLIYPPISFLDGALAGGETSIPVVAGRAAGWSLTGTVTIDAGLASEESIPYLYRTDTEIVLDGTVANAHDDGAPVTQEDAAGLGLGDTGDLGAGGTFANAAA